VSDQPPPRGSDKGPGRPHLGRYVAAAVLALYVILFALFNRDRVEVDWVFFDRNSRLIYVVIVSALLGALADRLIQRRRRE
jgi:uncharacterized integral membrane protein